MNTPFSVEFLKENLQDKGFRIFGFDECPTFQRDYNLNIVGVRRKDSVPNFFNDELHVFWHFMCTTHHCFWPITTYPGTFYLLNPVHKKGTAILKPGQYLSSYRLGEYKGYTALRQAKPVTVYRDWNQDSFFDIIPETEDTGNFGIHIHKAGIFSKIVGPSSAGCQVFQKAEDFNKFISICISALLYWGNSFTYTLIEE